MEVLIYIDFTAWLYFFTPHCIIKTFRKQNSSQPKKPLWVYHPFLWVKLNSIRSPIVMEATCLLDLKANLHQWEENGFKAIKHKDMTFGSGRPWSANCWHVWDKDLYTVPLLSPGRCVGDKWGGLTQKKLLMPCSFMYYAGLCFEEIVLFQILHKNTLQNS